MNKGSLSHVHEDACGNGELKKNVNQPEKGGDPSSGQVTSHSQREKENKEKRNGSGTGPSGAPVIRQLQQAIQRLRIHGQRDLEDPELDLLSAEGQSVIRKHKFWNTQPVPQFHEEVGETENGPIEPNVSMDAIREIPYALPDLFEWSDVDVENERELEELYHLLSQNYVEDDDAMFRFDYSSSFLHWAIQPPGWDKKWHVGVRVSTNKKLVAFICAIPAQIHVGDRSFSAVEINFLCVHKKLRTKRLAPVLIKEITRRVNRKGIFQAAFTAGALLPRPISACRYFHRLLQPKTLVEIGFSQLGKNMSMSRLIKLNRLPSERPLLSGLRSFDPQRDAVAVQRYLMQYLEQQFTYYPRLSVEEVIHYFSPHKNVMYSYVIERPHEDSNTKDENDKSTEKETSIIAFVSFYCLPSSVIHHPVHKTLRAAYLYYYFLLPSAESVNGERSPSSSSLRPPFTLIDLIRDVLIIAKAEGFDVFNCLNLLNNEQFIEELRFGPGDGYLRYYLYNWKCARMNPTQLGLVLL